MGFRGFCGFIAFFLFHSISIAQSQLVPKFQCSTDISVIQLTLSRMADGLKIDSKIESLLEESRLYKSEDYYREILMYKKSCEKEIPQKARHCFKNIFSHAESMVRWFAKNEREVVDESLRQKFFSGPVFSDDYLSESFLKQIEKCHQFGERCDFGENTNAVRFYSKFKDKEGGSERIVISQEGGTSNLYFLAFPYSPTHRENRLIDIMEVKNDGTFSFYESSKRGFVRYNKSCFRCHLNGPLKISPIFGSVSNKRILKNIEEINSSFEKKVYTSEHLEHQGTPALGPKICQSCHGVGSHRRPFGILDNPHIIFSKIANFEMPAGYTQSILKGIEGSILDMDRNFVERTIERSIKLNHGSTNKLFLSNRDRIENREAVIDSLRKRQGGLGIRAFVGGFLVEREVQSAKNLSEQFFAESRINFHHWLAGERESCVLESM